MCHSKYKFSLCLYLILYFIISYNHLRILNVLYYLLFICCKPLIGQRTERKKNLLFYQ